MSPGQTIEYRCVPRSSSPLSASYCLALLSLETSLSVNGVIQKVPVYAAGIGSKGSDDNYQACVSGPAARTECTTYPFQPVSPSGSRLGINACFPDQGAGAYTIDFRVRGRDLGSLTYDARIPSPITFPCVSDLGKVSVGAHLGQFNSDIKRVSRYSLPTPAIITKLAVYLVPRATAGQALIRGILYGDVNGPPGPLLGATTAIAFTSADKAGWYDLTFPTPVRVPAGNYWLGVITGGQPFVADFKYDSVPGVRDYNSNPFASGPSDPFGPITTDDFQMSLYALYEVAP